MAGRAMLALPICGVAVLWYSYYTQYDMAPRDKVITFRPDNDTFDAMASLRERDGVPFSEQIRRALRAWLVSKGAMKADRRRGTNARKRT